MPRLWVIGDVQFPHAIGGKWLCIFILFFKPSVYILCSLVYMLCLNFKRNLLKHHLLSEAFLTFHKTRDSHLLCSQGISSRFSWKARSDGLGPHSLKLACVDPSCQPWRWGRGRGEGNVIYLVPIGTAVCNSFNPHKSCARQCAKLLRYFHLIESFPKKKKKTTPKLVLAPFYVQDQLSLRAVTCLLIGK